MSKQASEADVRHSANPIALSDSSFDALSLV